MVTFALYLVALAVFIVDALYPSAGCSGITPLPSITHLLSWSRRYLLLGELQFGNQVNDRWRMTS